MVGVSVRSVIGKRWGGLQCGSVKKEEASSWGKLLAFVNGSGGVEKGYAERAEGCGPTCRL